MTLRYSGITHFTGDPDSGKTIAMLQVTHPSKIAFFHDDVKVPPVKPNDFGLFVDLVQEAKGKKLLEFRQLVLDRLYKLKPNQFEAIIFDTWARFGLSLRQYAILNPAEFREMNTFSKLGSAKGGEMWGEAHRYEALVISELAKIAPFVGLVTHLKDAYEGGAKTGRKIPDAGKSFDRVCNFRVWLRHNPDSGVPIGLVLKRLNESKVTEKGLEVVNILPWKLVPKDGESSVWDVIDRYRGQPFGNRQPMQDETPDNFEMSILTGVMTKEQREIWQANLKEKFVLERESEFLVDSQEDDIVTRVKAMDSEGLGLIDIVEQINSEFGRDFGPSDIQAYMDRG
jgi:hypothetical protein